MDDIIEIEDFDIENVFSGFTKRDVNLVKLIFRLYIPKFVVKVFINYSKKNTKQLIKSNIVDHYGNN